jgi:hypothetical protein
MASPSSTRRCAVALLCAALVLVAVCARAASIVVSGDVTQSGDAFNGDSITFNLDGVHAEVATVQLINSKVTGDGLTIQGYSGSVPSGVSTRISMSVTSTTVTDSTIFFTGILPSNSDIRLASTTGTLTAAQSLFDFTGLVLKGNVTVTVDESTVTWPSGSGNTGSVVTYSAGEVTPGISTQGALFILNATAVNGASVLHLNAENVFAITDSGVLAVDYGRCDGCSSALVDIDEPLKIDGSSMFRITHATVVNGAKGLLASAGYVTVSDKSLYLVSDCAIESGSFFDYNTGSGASGGAAFAFTVTDSTVSYIGLTGPSFGIASGSSVPTSVQGSSTVNGGNCTIGGTAFTTTSQYQSNGLAVTQVVDSNGVSGSTCANANCVPGHSNAGAAGVSGTACSCACSASTYNPPSCTAVSDPTQNYGTTASCSLPNCATCDRLYPSSRCTQCNTGYELSADYQCQLITTTKEGDTTTTTTSTTTTTTTSTTTTTALCSVTYCVKCSPTDGSTCVSCRNGYKLTSGVCIANINGAAAAQSALIAALVSIVAVYAL